MAFKKFYSKFYDLVYFKKKYKKEISFLLNLLKKKKIKFKKILELGSGTGSHGKYLKKLGFDIIGVEKSSQMIKISKEKKIGFKIYNSDLKEFRINKKFDLVISLFHVINYMTKKTSLNKFFDTASFHLKKNGYLVFDTWYTPGVNFIKPSKKIKIFTNKEFKVVKKVFPKKTNKTNFDINYKFEIFNKSSGLLFHFFEKHKIRHFNIDDLVLVARKKNFEYLSSHKQLSESKPSKRDWGATLIFKKI